MLAGSVDTRTPRHLPGHSRFISIEARLRLLAEAIPHYRDAKTTTAAPQTSGEPKQGEVADAENQRS